MKKTVSSGLKKRSTIMPNERRRQLWRRHRLRLIERRSKWFHQSEQLPDDDQDDAE
ncbi:hypothetical protein ACR0ST_01260 [Aliidiomarina sp. Khilg15.8]